MYLILRYKLLNLFLIIALSLIGLSGSPSNASPTAVQKTYLPKTSLVLLDNTLVNLSSVTGPIIINFWATWCAPCIKEMPDLEKLQIKHGARLKIYAVNIGQRQDLIQQFIERYKIKLTVAVDKGGELARTWGVKGLPMTFVFGKDKSLIDVVLGPTTWETYSLEGLTPPQ